MRRHNDPLTFDGSKSQRAAVAKASGLLDPAAAVSQVLPRRRINACSGFRFRHHSCSVEREWHSWSTWKHQHGPALLFIASRRCKCCMLTAAQLASPRLCLLLLFELSCRYQKSTNQMKVAYLHDYGSIHIFRAFHRPSKFSVHMQASDS